jgi:hypothetical protein
MSLDRINNPADTSGEAVAMPANHQFIDILGQRFGRLTVTMRVENDRHGQACWLCRCQCGGDAVVTGSYLRRGLIESCGCRRVENSRDMRAKHGRSFTAEHRSWLSLRQRAKRLGLWMDPSWESFEGFFSDLGERPPGHRLRRYGQDEGYGPLNCYWAPPAR